MYDTVAYTADGQPARATSIGHVPSKASYGNGRCFEGDESAICRASASDGFKLQNFEYSMYSKLDWTRYNTQCCGDNSTKGWFLGSFSYGVIEFTIRGFSNGLESLGANITNYSRDEFYKISIRKYGITMEILIDDVVINTKLITSSNINYNDNDFLFGGLDYGYFSRTGGVFYSVKLTELDSEGNALSVKAHYPLCETGTTRYDISGNGNHLTLVNPSPSNNVGYQNEYFETQKGFLKPNYIPLLADGSAFADGTAKTDPNAVLQDGYSWLNDGTTIEQQRTPRMVGTELEGVKTWADVTTANNAYVEESTDNKKNIRVFNKTLKGVQHNTELRIVETYYSDAFIMTVQMSAGETMSIPANSDSNNFLAIDWGETVQYNVRGANPSYTYQEAGTYQIKLKGYMPNFSFANAGSHPNRNNVLSVDQIGRTGLTEVQGMVRGCFNITNFNGEGFDTSRVTDMSDMFNSCYSLENISGTDTWDVSNVTALEGMFVNCKIVSINTVGWDVSNVIDTRDMFAGCTSLTHIYGIDAWDVSNVRFMPNMFIYCTSLTSLDISNWDVSQVMSATSMFSYTNLTTLDLRNFDVSNMVEISSIFEGCASLTSLDISTWDTSKASDLNNFADGCTSLTDIVGIELLDVSNCDDFYSMLYQVTLPTARYDATLKAWAAQTLKDGGGYEMDFGNSKYTSSDPDVVSARNKIINTYNWAITDGGSI